MGGSFSAQSADLHSVWGAYKRRNRFRQLGALHVSPEGFVHWVGRWTIALIQFRANVLLATDAPRTDFQEVVEEVRGVLEEVWGIPVRCDCANDAGVCQDRCMGPVCRVMGYCIVQTPQGGGMSHVQPAALRDDWSLRHAAPLISPVHGYKGYLAGIFSSALCNGRKWTESWAAQIVSALAWVQVALLSG